MTAAEVADIAIALAKEEGWNPGLYDALCFYAADANGFLVGLLDGEPVACISAVAYDTTFGFIGLYIVKPGYRGKGYGLQIWNAAMNYLGNRNIGLDGVTAQQENYKKSGFALAYRNIRYEGISRAMQEQYADILFLAEITLEEIVQYDTQLFPAARPDFLRMWTMQPGSRTVVALHDGAVAGYGTIRQCDRGYKIGPLFADTDIIAEELFATLNNTIAPGSTIYLDTPEINPAAVALAQRHGMTVVFETARMYTGEVPTIDVQKVFGVTTFELG